MGFAACALILTSCSKSEITENLDQNNGQLKFNTVMGSQTRAFELMNGNLQNDATSVGNGIALYAYQNVSGWSQWYTDELLYGGYAGKPGWGIGSTRFRNMAATKYISYYPQTANGGPTEVAGSFANATFTGVATNFPQFTYTIAAPATQVDLVAGVTEVAANQTDITIGLRHILSQVNFGVYGYTGANIEITDIKIWQVAESGTFTYNATNTYPIGAWVLDADLQDYDYDIQGGVVPTTASTGDKYIFGDGGNFAVGTGTTVFYDESGVWKNFAAINVANGNSLMLMPQTLTVGPTTAYVTFHYKITDVDGAVVADDDGTFDLNFVANNAYANEWKQNMRYVYIIDFEKFLDDNQLDFTVTVEMYPWENYNNGGTPGGGDGIVDVPVAGEPTNTQLKTLATGATWYVASRSTTAGSTDVQIVASQTWDWTSYTFDGLDTGETITLNFSNVIFNGKNIQIILDNAVANITTLPTGVASTAGTGSNGAEVGQTIYTITGTTFVAPFTVNIVKVLTNVIP